MDIIYSGDGEIRNVLFRGILSCGSGELVKKEFSDIGQRVCRLTKRKGKAIGRGKWVFKKNAAKKDSISKANSC